MVDCTDEERRLREGSNKDGGRYSILYTKLNYKLTILRIIFGIYTHCQQIDFSK